MMDRLQSASKYCKSQEQQKVIPRTNHRDIQNRRYQKQPLEESKEVKSNAEENKSFVFACSSNWVERNKDLKPFQVPMRNLRKQGVRNVFIDSSKNKLDKDFTVHNDNGRIECSSRSRIQTNINLCPQTNKHNNVFVKRNNQNVQHEESKNGFLEKSNAHTFQKITPKTENSCMSNGNAFNKFELKDLLYYNPDFMQHDQLHDYTYALRSKILEEISEFKNHQDELKFLCDLTDGSLRWITDQYLKSIIQKMHSTIKKSIKETPQSSDISNSNSNTHETQLPTVHASNPGLISGTDDLTASFKRNIPCGPHVNTTESIIDNVAEDEESTYGSLSLKDLLNCDVEVMHDNLLIDYAFSLKKRVLEIMLDFKIEERERLEPLCKLQDGTQSEINQKLIAFRMNLLVTTFCENRNKLKSIIQRMHSTIKKSIKETPESSDIPRGPNVNTTESIIDNVAEDEESTYGSLSLTDLLNYDVEVMHGNLLYDYAFSLKKRVLENMLYFKIEERERLKPLCKLQDGKQSEINQKLIAFRMNLLVTSFRKNRNFPRNPISQFTKPNYHIRRQ